MLWLGVRLEKKAGQLFNGLRVAFPWLGNLHSDQTHFRPSQLSSAIAGVRNLPPTALVGITSPSEPPNFVRFKARI